MDIKTTKYLKKEFDEINALQDKYIDKLIELMDNPTWVDMKRVNFNSDTGTGKTQMMSKLIKKFPDRYFIITTLSKGQLHEATRERLTNYCSPLTNFDVYGTMDYRINSKLQADEIIDKIPKGVKCIWLRDEGHIKTNRFDKLLEEKCYKVVNVSATNELEGGITCNFMHTNMLRRVNQEEGYPEDAIAKLVEIKELHKNVPNYNPCAIFRLVKPSDDILVRTIKACKANNLKWINITDDKFDMKELCKDDNEYDVIINKFKIVEGIDIKRAHVLFMDNQPGNVKTTIQVIGRCRRNALLYNTFPTEEHAGTGIDILNPKNEDLLRATQECFVYYNMLGMKLEEDEEGRLQQAFCNKVSCQAILPNKTITVKDGQMQNGLYVIELEGETGTFEIVKDENLGFNIVKPITSFYDTRIDGVIPCVYCLDSDGDYAKIYANDLKNFPINNYEAKFDLSMDRVEFFKTDLYYSLDGKRSCRTKLKVKDSLLEYFKRNRPNINKNTLKKHVNLNYTGQDSQEYTQVEFIIYKEVNSLNDLENYDISSLEVNESDVDYLIKRLERSMNRVKWANITEYEIEDLIESINENYIKIENSINNNDFILRLQIKPINLNKYMHECTKFEETNLIKGNLPLYDKKVPLNVIHMYKQYTKVFNDYESAVIGPELLHGAKLKNDLDENNKPKIIWVETKGVTSKINSYTKLSEFISNKYSDELKQAKKQCFNGKNNFRLDTKCNSMLGYCVEYYSKYLLYGDTYLGYYINKVLKDTKSDTINDAIIIRACILKYKELMVQSYRSSSMGSLIKTISVESLVQSQYKYFVKTIKRLGEQTAKFVRETLYKNKEVVNDVDPSLSIDHITGLADYVTNDTILDVKVTNHIDLGLVRQVLAYHYLSTKRSDLNIKRVIVYDATSGKHVTVDISPENWKENQKYGYKEEMVP